MRALAISAARHVVLAVMLLPSLIGAAGAQSIFNKIAIEVSDSNTAVKQCADELVKRAKGSALVPKGISVVPIREVRDDMDKIRKSGKRVLPYIFVTDKTYDSEIIKQPFVFRDAEHVLAFLNSGEFYRQIRDNPTLSFEGARLAIAYGGFYQMFSKTAAVTEPKHFYKRSIGGTVREPTLYMHFGAVINLLSLSGMFVGLDARAAEEMGSDNSMSQIVEAHLASAIENGFKGKGRFVNLISSSMVAVDIVVKKAWDDEEIRAEDMAALRGWAEQAAAACSEANYQKELDALEALKADGYQIVPFNRNALVEKSWFTALESSHGYWTIEQFDQLVRLGNFPRNGLVPSSLVSKLPAPKRQEVLKHDSEAAFRLNESKKWNESRDKARLQSNLPPDQLPPLAPASDGEKAFNRCRSCHQVGETARNAMGPQLNGLLGRKVASAPGFSYSDAIKGSRIVWTEAELANFLKNPKVVTPNPAHAEFSDVKQIENLIQYLKQFKADGKNN